MTTSDSIARRKSPCYGLRRYREPKLAGVVSKDFPEAADQIALVTGGQGTMPGFGRDLSEEQIRQVVEYTRTELGG